MWHKIANLILKNRWFIISLLLIALVFFGYFAFSGIKIDNKYGNMLPAESPTQKEFQKFKDKFGEDGSTLLIAIKDDKLYSQNHFLNWKKLGDSILQIDGVESVISEATLVSIKNDALKQKFEVHPVFSDVKFKEKSIEQIESEIKNNPVYADLLYNDKTNVSLMLVVIDERYLSDKKKSNVIIQIEDLAMSYSKTFGQIHFAGLPHMRIIIGNKVINEMYVFIGLAICVTSLLLYLFFKSIRLVIVCNTVVLISVVSSLGSIGLLGFNISVLMALIPPLMIVIGIPNCIFLMTKYHQELRYSGNRIKSIYSVFQKIGTATFLTNFTTALGFATFILTDSDKLIEFGIIASINILMVFVFSICIIPIFLSFLKNPKERHLKHLDRKLAVGLIEKLVYITNYKRKWVYLITILVVVISCFGMLKIKATGNLTGDLPKNDPVLKDVKFIEKNFGGAIPFEIMINYKEKGRLYSNETLKKLEDIQLLLKSDTIFSKSMCIVDLMKVVNMAFYNNDSSQYRVISDMDKLRLKKYIHNFDLADVNSSNINIKELVDTASCTLRIRTQIKDLGSYEISHHVTKVKKGISQILNPNKEHIETCLLNIKRRNYTYIDTLMYEHSSVFNTWTAKLSKDSSDLQMQFDLDPTKIIEFKSKKEFIPALENAINHELYGFSITGTSVVVSKGTQYLVANLVSSILFAIGSISVLMAILFRSWRMVAISLIPNLIPLVFTSGIMGWFGIPLKPSTLLVFSIAFGISVDDTIHYLAKYRQELKSYSWDIKSCVTMAIRESGLGMFYTSVVLFCGFSTFSFSQFGGTQALGMLISLTLFMAMITNLVVLPALLMTLDRFVTTKSFGEPYFDIYDEEEDIELENLKIQKKI